MSCWSRKGKCLPLQTLSEWESKIKTKLTADPRQWGGYKLIHVDSYSKETTKIQCGLGHISFVRAMWIVWGSRGCLAMECITHRRFSTASTYKTLTYKDMTTPLSSMRPIRTFLFFSGIDTKDTKTNFCIHSYYS